ncbi:uncharacterized protein C1orf100-like [Hippoglossus hippoglossus]|uniref:uncharacterized protein C1orf100-like n=1 Tax=Hippoglossus hippoglossus TaxID=8267 RepID=UPI00148E83BD|nr:uncharacterized protein C1orf100-like [Hippoglossus hippoglossus]XP_047198418.1 uncharacterized protein C1orf100-like [Hippoglossus stenolepis]
MAGSGVAVRLHEFRESGDGSNLLKPQTSRQGRDAQGLYPGQLGRVHTVHAKDCGYRLHSGKSHDESPNHQHQQSFDIRTLRALTVLRHSPAVPKQRPLQTTYQEEFGHQSPLFPH